VLGGIADTVAQTLTAVRQRAVRKQGGPGKDDFLAIEIHDLDRRNPLSDMDLIPDSKLLPPPFDFERTVRFMSYGFIMSPLQHRWFKFLSSTFPISKTETWLPALKRVAFDQFLFAPFGRPLSIQESGGTRALLTWDRSCVLLYLYDRCRRRWEARCAAQIPGHLRACVEGQLDGVAHRADHQLPHHAYSVPDCKDP
jgi:hypothetical protein